MSKLSEDLIWRGLIKDKTFDKLDWLDSPKKFYLGIDASSDGLTIGNLAVVMLARRFIDAGWEAIILCGGATSLVGDPGGKEEERELKSEEEIAKNIAGVKKELEQLFDGQKHETVNNLDWFGAVKYLDFLREVGKNYSMTELLQRDFVSSRIGSEGTGISYAEFSYSLLQGFDFWWLYKNKRVVLQIGASDQWGNMLSGVPLVRKKEGVDVHAMSMPLVINKQTGKKFGKSEEGAVWLDKNKTTPTQFYQFWINTSDDSVEEYLKIYTLLSKSDIDNIMKIHQAEPQSRIAQTRLAQEVTSLVHGGKIMEWAETVTEYLTGRYNIGQADTVLKDIRKNIASHKTSVNGSVVEALVATGLASSNSEARRFIKENAISMNGVKSVNEKFEASDFDNGKILLRRGKAFKDSALIELE